MWLVKEHIFWRTKCSEYKLSSDNMWGYSWIVLWLTRTIQNRRVASLDSLHFRWRLRWQRVQFHRNNTIFTNSKVSIPSIDNSASRESRKQTDYKSIWILWRNSEEIWTWGSLPTVYGGVWLITNSSIDSR